MFEFIFVAFIGLILGAVNAELISYFINNKTFLTRCHSCYKQDKLISLISCLRLIMNKHRCYFCGDKIRVLYLVQEVSTALLLVLIWSQYDFSMVMIIITISALFFMLISTLDFKKINIPDGIFVYIIVIAVLFAYFNNFPLVAILVMPLLMLFIALFLKYSTQLFFSKQGLSSFEVRLFFVSGFYLEVENISIFLLMCAGFYLLFSITISLLTNVQGYKPLVPSICLAIFLCILFPYQTQLFNLLQ